VRGLHQPDQAGGSRRHDLIPNLLPAVVTQGSYDVRDLSAGQSSRGNLSESSLVVDQTLGASVIPLGVTRCSCALDGPGWSPDAFFFLLADGDDLTDAASIDATDECDGTLVDASGDFTSWLSSDTAVATVATKKVTAVGAGTATATADGSILESTGAGTCAFVPVHPSAQVTVLSAIVTLNSSGQVSPTDGASTLYKGVIGSLNLGIMAGQLGVNNGCYGGNELVGSVTPSTSAGPVTVKRTLTSGGCYQGSTAKACPVANGADDTGKGTLISSVGWPILCASCKKVGILQIGSRPLAKPRHLHDQRINLVHNHFALVQPARSTYWMGWPFR
jgi:hypothetical protein